MELTRLYIAGLLSLLMTGCTKQGCMDPTAVNFDPAANKDNGSCLYNTDYAIHIEDPLIGGTYSHGDTVYVNIDIETAFNTHGYEAILVNKTNNDTVLMLNDHAHDLEHSLHGFWFNNVTVDSQMELIVKIFNNHYGTGKIEESIEFTCLAK